MPFFIRKGNSLSTTSSKKKTRKAIVKNGSINKSTNKNKKFKSRHESVDGNGLNEEILSDEIEDEDIFEDDIDDPNEGTKQNKRKKINYEGDSENENETAQEKKIRLAKKYLAQLEQSEMFDNRDDDDHDDDIAQVHRSNLISIHLKESVLEKMGKLHQTVADQYRLGSNENVIMLKNGHRKSITAMVISQDGRFIFTAAKDCNLVKWDRSNGKRLKTIYGNYRENSETFIQGHTGTINALAISSDFKFLASGCVKKVIHIWSPDTMTHLHTFRGHRGAITGLVFRRSFHQLFSCSEDRIVKVWNLDEMGYVESLFGHHDSIMAIDSFVRERCLTAGGRDGTIRLWKIPEESNLIFLTSSMATIDCVTFIDESHFLSASDDGSISLWGIFKKKPLYTIHKAHEQGHWITSIASLKNTDLFASGSHDGRITFWKVCPEFKRFEQLFHYQVEGFVNSMEFSHDGQYLVAAISQEHRCGRWFERYKHARNVVHIIPLFMVGNNDS